MSINSLAVSWLGSTCGVYAVMMMKILLILAVIVATTGAIRRWHSLTESDREECLAYVGSPGK